MNFTTAIKTCFRKSFDFTGRASRSEYWWFFLISFPPSYLGKIILFRAKNADMGVTSSTSLVLLLLFLVLWEIPRVAVGIRRLHDAGYSGWWNLVPYPGLFIEWWGIFVSRGMYIVLIILFCSKGESKTNECGPPLGKNGLPVVKKTT